jgi:thiol-disulfide isomerase/thioredoxin
MAIFNRISTPILFSRLPIWAFIFSIFIFSLALAGERKKPELPTADSIPAISQAKTPQVDSLLASLKSGKPTLAYFYYSVACSCTAARCEIAASAIDSIPELQKKNDLLNFIKVDAFLEAEAEKLFKVPIIPAIVYFDKNGIELNRLEWGTNKEAIATLIKHPEIKQRPVD